MRRTSTGRTASHICCRITARTVTGHRGASADTAGHARHRQPATGTGIGPETCPGTEEACRRTPEEDVRLRLICDTVAPTTGWRSRRSAASWVTVHRTLLRRSIATRSGRLSPPGPRRWTRSSERAVISRTRLSGCQVTCRHVLPLTAAQADTSLMPNSAASCRYVSPCARRARSSRTFSPVSVARGLPSPRAPS
jgi:hypothetical protein